MRIISVVQNLTQCCAYLKDGTTVKYPVDSEEAELIFKAIPEIATKGYADVDLVKNPKNTFDTLSEVTGMKLFQCFCEVAERIKKEPELLKDVQEITEKYLGVVGEGKTVVAVKDGKIISGIEKLNTYINKAYKLQQYTGIKALIERLMKIADDRQHTIDDLLTFLEKADLPIADDGSIIAYKMVSRMGDKYVDCHTGRVEQEVGSHVFMAPDMVDPDRSHECSQGLHIARRAYLQWFGGEVCLLVKFNPEDVIAVPNYDANKIRVCAYDILAEIPQECTDLLKSNRSMTSLNAGKELLAKAINCQFPAPTKYTEITGSMGHGCVYGKYDKKGKMVAKREVSKKEATSLDETTKVDVKEARRKIKEMTSYINNLDPNFVNTPLKKIREIYAKNQVTQDEYMLVDGLRKRMKKSWAALGMTNWDFKLIK